MLQRIAEQLEYYDFLKIANKENDSCLRMCYVIGFAVGAYASNINRVKKPFNPILGETFELIHNSFRFVSEQVRFWYILIGFTPSSYFCRVC
jgi:hypothetical protein